MGRGGEHENRKKVEFKIEGQPEAKTNASKPRVAGRE